MHIPDGMLTGPVIAASYAVAGGVCALAVARANRTLDERRIPLLGMTAAFVFAAQMINFPVAGGTSGHFLGALLAAVLLGPLNACLILALVLVIQCLVFQDGGLTALGANALNMGVIGGVVSYALIFWPLRAALPRRRWAFQAAAAVAAWGSVVLAAAACAAELALSDQWPLHVALTAMVGVHALIGIGEAIITSAVLSIVLAVRPDLVPGAGRLPRNAEGRPA